ncbi:hypothetical protein PP7435_CHR3-1030 [Komagataella phaffii CBS 7435]|uniref:RRM domain-containing protein n=1 Tax=Komagataella phaffii (strain ATCC 76273 / CBS 7435 / CECT 11047 / NRRL Y-11430 / Wegner 21-1) TaxID=981350 RepID=F2QX48_KOMPC|nr:GQ67_03240T0 [Komagataella phaffii]CAH2450032.1 hypothetical protein BQ9382_C3-5420 [Komagataella phaffii CBS 7435]CCA39976.1 hypothetical protein PP7435_CHR3-1030 [Komagataella phaffii CBS 7435]
MSDPESTPQVPQEEETIKETPPTEEVVSKPEDTASVTAPEEASNADDDEYDPEGGFETEPKPAESASESVSVSTAPPITTTSTILPTTATPSSTGEPLNSGYANTTISAPVVPDEEEEDSDVLKVRQFNEIISWFMNSPLVSDRNFQNLQPADKEAALLKAFNESNNKSYTISINFGATTSFNNPQSRTNNAEFPLIPINVYCQRPDLVGQMSFDELRDYSQFVAQESTFLKSGKWDNFPIGSRLFIGNLPVSTVNKQDVFRIYHAYGNVKQINIKQGYGFVQFDSAESCSDAIKGETNVPLHGKMLHLEISKAQIQKALEQQGRKPVTAQASSRRSRSRSPPDYRDNSPPVDNNVPEVKVFATSVSNAAFNRAIIKSLQKHSFNYELDNKYPHVSDDLVNDAAYNGTSGVIVTNNNNTVNLKVFQKSPDGGIKFEEYARINVDEAVNILLSNHTTRPPAMKKQRNEERGRRMPGSSSYGGNYGNMGMNQNQNQNMNQNSNPNQMSQGQGNMRRNISGQNRYREREDRYGNSGNNGNQWGNNNRYQQPPQQQSVPQQQGWQQPPQQQGYNAQQQQALQQLQNLDPSALQNVLSLVQGMGGGSGSPPQMPQQDYGNHQIPPQQQQQQRQQHYDPYGNNRQHTPSSNDISALIGQYNQPQSNSGPLPNHQHSQNNQNPNSGSGSNESSGNDLLSTLARLQKNL